MRVLKFLAIAAAAATLTGCLGGGGGGTAAAPELRGTAAIGAPLAGATVTLRGANGVEIETRANLQGEFVFSDISRLTAPAMLQAEGNAGGAGHTLFSVASTFPTAGGSAVANVTPLTHAVLSRALGAEPTLQDTPNATQLNDLNLALTRLSAALADVFVALGLPANTNPLSTPFAANQTGLDKLLDLIVFRFENNDLQIANNTGGGNETFVPISLVGAPPPVFPAAPALSWDLTVIKPFIDRFNAAALNDNARRAFFHADFLHDAQRIESAIVGLRGSRIEQAAINGCRSIGNIETCTIRGLLVNPATIDNPFVIDFRRVGTEWRIFGNQSPTVTQPTVKAPTAAAVPTGSFNFDLPSAPTNAILQGNFNGNMAFRIVQFDGTTHTVQATVGSTLLRSRMAFGGLPGNLGNLVVDTDRLYFGLNDDRVHVVSTLNDTPISVMLDGAGNVAVGCPPPRNTLESTVVLLSHNLRRVTLEHAMANGLGGQDFDLINCRAAKIGNTGGHNDWLKITPEGALIYNGIDNPDFIQTPPEFVDMLSPEGFQDTDGGGSWHDRAQIYELVIGGYRMFFILRHAKEWDGILSTTATPSRQYVELWIPR